MSIFGLTGKYHTKLTRNYVRFECKLPKHMNDNVILAYVHKRAIQKAFNQIQSSSCVRFIPVLPEHTDFVSFIPGKGYVSFV